MCCVACSASGCKTANTGDSARAASMYSQKMVCNVCCIEPPVGADDAQKVDVPPLQKTDGKLSYTLIADKKDVCYGRRSAIR